MNLTDTKIKGLKPKEKMYRLSDGNGLALAVFPSGNKTWQMRYTFDGKENIYSFGAYPFISLKDARLQRDEIRESLTKGFNPKEKHQAEEIKNKLSFSKIAMDWCETQTNWIQDHKIKVVKSIQQHLFPYLGDLCIDQLTTKKLIEPISHVQQLGMTDLASRLQQRIKAILRYAVQLDLIAYNPAQELDGIVIKTKVTHRPALDIKEIPMLIRNINKYDGYPLTKLALQFALLTFTRSSEIRLARWSEIDFDAKLWTIPAERNEVDGVKHSHRGSKMKEIQLVPLSDSVIHILNEIHKLTGDHDFVFSGVKNKNKPMSENTLNKALRKMGYDTKTELCLHGFRAIACSALVESGQWNRDAIERQMSHQERNNVRRAYIHKAEHLIERTKMMQWWADYLSAIQINFIPPYEFKPQDA